ncbi:MAG: nitrogenase component 1 [Elusimicrobia bacterium]|nr:nitrogenase component 1 [Elusimicrobiota bacterium]
MSESCCVMRYAWQTLTCIAGPVAVIVHGPNGCGADFSLPSRPQGAAGDYCATDLSEMDAIMGGEDALAAKLAAVRKRSRPELIFVLGTCVSELIGDDARAVCAQAAARLGVPIIFLPTSGLVDRGAGDPAVDVFKALVEGFMKPGRRGAGSVNFLAFPWADYRGVRDELARCLSALDIRLNAILTGTPSLAELARAPRAALNVIVDDDPGRRAGLWMKERFGTPYILVPRPSGLAATSRMFRLMVEACGGGTRRAALVEVWRRRELRRLAEEHPGLRGRSLAWAGPRPPMLDVRPPGSFLMYSGMRELAGELEAELGSRFFARYGPYCRRPERPA